MLAGDEVWRVIRVRSPRRGSVSPLPEMKRLAPVAFMPVIERRMLWRKLLVVTLVAACIGGPVVMFTLWLVQHLGLGPGVGGTAAIIVQKHGWKGLYLAGCLLFEFLGLVLLWQGKA